MGICLSWQMWVSPTGLWKTCLGFCFSVWEYLFSLPQWICRVSGEQGLISLFVWQLYKRLSVVKRFISCMLITNKAILFVCIFVCIGKLPYLFLFLYNTVQSFNGRQKLMTPEGSRGTACQQSVLSSVVVSSKSLEGGNSTPVPPD